MCVSSKNCKTNIEWEGYLKWVILGVSEFSSTAIFEVGSHNPPVRVTLLCSLKGWDGESSDAIPRIAPLRDLGRGGGGYF